MRPTILESSVISPLRDKVSTEAEFLVVIGPLFEQKWFETVKLVCNVDIVYGNLKSANSQDFAQNLNEIVRSWKVKYKKTEWKSFYQLYLRSYSCL
jgi:hypothetical protein